MKLRKCSGSHRFTSSVGALLDLDQRLWMAMNASPEVTVVCDAGRKITLANAAARTLAMLDPEGTLLDSAPQVWGEMFDCTGQYVPAEQWPWMRALQGETIIRQECRLVQSGIAGFDILFSAAPMRAVGGDIVGSVGSLTDITLHQRAEATLRKRAVWQERSRIAAEIHDTLLQGLSAIVLQLEAAEENFTDNISYRHVHKAQEITRETLAEARRSMWSLSQGSAGSEELAPALSFMAKQLFAGTTVKLEFSFSDESHNLWPEVTLELLRIGKEALANVRKHAQANRVQIAVVYTNEEVQLRVDDDGQGFRMSSSSPQHGGFGLIGMRSRAERLGGRFVVDSQPGRGTRVMALLPIPANVLQKSAA